MPFLLLHPDFVSRCLWTWRDVFEMKLFELEACESLARSMSSGDRINVANYQTFYSLEVLLLVEAFRCPSRINQRTTAIKTQINIHLSSTFVLVSDKIVPERKLYAASSPQ